MDFKMHDNTDREFTPSYVCTVSARKPKHLAGLDTYISFSLRGAGDTADKAVSEVFDQLVNTELL